MKILRLQFKNLNSLYGEWEIDFTNQSFQQDGLFVLSGPTGAGKSTILDAVCLALYGQTPRLGKITQSSNEIMSKHTAVCYSLLHFETNGTQYYARFDQRKAKNNPNGKLQDVERSIAKDSPTNIICRKKTDINDEIIRITGMDFSRFTRSILLAQGAFDSFLKARDEEKSMLLEQITGTEIYSEISKAVFERTKQEKDKTQELTLLTENALILSQEEIENLQNRQKENETELLALNNALKQIQNSIVWLNQIQNLEKKIEEGQKNHTELLEKQKNSQEEKIHLLNAEKAEKLFPEYNILTRQEKELHDLAAALKQKEISCPEQEKKLDALTEKLEQIQKKQQEQSALYEKNSPLFEEIKKIDTLLETKKQNIITQKKQIQKEEQEYQIDIEELKQLTSKKNAVAENLSKITSWLNNNQNFALLKQNLNVLSQKLGQLNTLVEKSKQTKKLILSQQNELSRQQENKNKQEQTQKQAEEERNDNIKTFEKITSNLNILLNNSKLDDLRKQLSLLQKNKIFQLQIASLEEQRKTLEVGKPCPLCGATDHPFITDHAALSFDNAIDTEIDQLEKRIKEIEKLQYDQKTNAVLIQKNNEQISAIHQTLTEFSKQIEEKSSLLTELQKEKDALFNQYEKQKQELEQELVIYKIPAVDPQHPETIIAQLESSCAVWDKKSAEKQEIEQELQEKEIAAGNIQLKQELCLKSIEEKKQQLQTDQKEFETIKGNREELFGQRNPADEEKILQNNIKTLEKEKEECRQHKEEQNQEVIKLNEQISQLKTRIAEETAQAALNKEQFLQTMAEQGFSALEDFLKAYREQDTILTLQEFFKKLDQDIEVSKKQLSEDTQKLEEEKKKNLSQQSKQELEEHERNFTEKQKELLLAQGDIRGKLEQNKKLTEENKENIQKLEKQKQQQEKWELLNSLIGSADGKKFRTIAQAVTFEHVIRYANAKLQLLQQRYLLIQNEQNPLTLCVLDNYQGGEIRAIQNLSGGETFIVSLSLALGLAQMASQNVQVDSLFLDEGFGTLDEENLDTALSTLASIQQEGKLIGVISHIPLLKERITTQIDVIPNHNGKSTLEGAGCTRIA